ncbi:MAG: hypothetical protein IJ746_01770 [Ruminococcus sp.]|nr:hypothetical protein [Ruminococcus sp.]
MNNSKISKNTAIVFLFDALLVCISIIITLLNSEGKFDIISAVLVIIFSGITAYRGRKNWYTLMMSVIILYYNYSICVAEYISVKKNTIFTSYAGSHIANEGIKILLIFNILFFIVINTVSKRSGFMRSNCTIIYDNGNNNLIVLGLFILLVLIWIFGFGRPEHVGDRGSPSTYFEYAIILIIMGFYYSGSSKSKHLLFTGVSFAYALLNFLYGGRATGVQVLLCLLLCAYIDKIDNKWLLIGGFLTFFAMSIIGSFRGSWSINTETVSSTWQSIINSKFTNDTAFSAYHTSMTFIDYLSLCSWSDRFYYFSRYLLYLPFGGSIYDSNLSQITRKYYTHYYGGVLPYYFYFYLGCIGIFLLAVYLYFLISSIIQGSNSNKPFWRCAGIYVTSTTFRWYIYSPSQITRGLLIFIVVFYGLHYFDKVSKNKQMHVKGEINEGLSS